MSTTKEVKVVGLVLEIDGKETVLSPEHCEKMYKALDRMFAEPKEEETALDKSKIDEALRIQQQQQLMEVERMRIQQQREAAMNAVWSSNTSVPSALAGAATGGAVSGFQPGGVISTSDDRADATRYTLLDWAKDKLNGD